MNKILSFSLIGAAALISMASCKKNNIVVGKTLTAPEFVKIGTWKAADTVGTYAVKSTNEPFKIPIGVTNVSNKDRTVNFTYSSTTAVQGVDYTAPASIVIKAGEALDSLPITGKFSSFGGSVTKSHKIVVAISGGDIGLNPTKTHYNLTMKMFWQADANAFSGVYDIQDYSGGLPDGGPYQVVIAPVSATGPTSVISISGIWGFDTPLVMVTLNWNDLNSGTTNVPVQNWVADLFGYGQSTLNPANTAATVFTKSPKKITIGYEAKVSAGSFGKEISVLTQP